MWVWDKGKGCVHLQGWLTEATEKVKLETRSPAKVSQWSRAFRAAMGVDNYAGEPGRTAIPPREVLREQPAKGNCQSVWGRDQPNQLVTWK